jgi:hypothetical protein
VEEARRVQLNSRSLLLDEDFGIGDLRITDDSVIEGCVDYALFSLSPFY